MFSLNLCTDGRGAVVGFDAEGNLKKYTVEAEDGKYKIKNEEVLLSNSELIIPEGMRINRIHLEGKYRPESGVIRFKYTDTSKPIGDGPFYKVFEGEIDLKDKEMRIFGQKKKAEG